MSRSRRRTGFSLPKLRLDLLGGSHRRTRRTGSGRGALGRSTTGRSSEPQPALRPTDRTLRRAPQKDRQAASRPTARPAAARSMARERSAPPVMVRGGSSAFSWQTASRRQGRLKRRYDITLNMPGAEMRLPAIPEINVGWRLFSFALVASLVALLYTMWNSPRFTVLETQINGLQRLSSRDVNTVLDVRNQPVFSLDATELRERLVQAFPEFSSVQVSISLPAEVVVTVEERQPVITWRQDGRTLLVDPNGVAFPLRNLEDPAPTLVVEAMGSPVSYEQDLLEAQTAGTNDSNQLLTVDMVSTLISLGAQAPAGVPLVYDPQRGFGWQDERGWQAYFGQVKDMEMKLKVYNALVNKLEQKGERPALISVEYVHTPYYRLSR